MRYRRWMMATIIALLGASSLSAVDGVIEINHARAVAGGVTPGDTPGYPVTINQPGSYRLTGGLLVPNEFFSAIEVTADDVSIDLNGFTIRGPALAGTGVGIDASDRLATRVHNGVIQGMGSHGAVVGFLWSVTDVTFYSNGGDGLNAYSGGTATRVASWYNAGDGIDAGSGSIVVAASVQANQGYGVRGPNIALVDGSVIQGNVTGGTLLGVASMVRASIVTNNLGPGIETGASSLVSGNAVSSNSGGGLVFPNTTASYGANVINGTVTSGLQLPPNNCSGVLCP